MKVPFIQSRFRVLWLILSMLAIGSIISPVPAVASTTAPNRPFMGRSLETEVDFWDQFFANQMEIFGVYGAEMVIVQSGEISFIKGYGFADAAQHTPMDPQSTIVRAGSIAKTLTAVAVIQLADRGQLDLDTDINAYLTRFKIPETFPEPVTARHLINMTGGLDTRAIGIRARSREKVQPLGDYLAKHMPPRVLPPGRYRRYNDHEVALAGHLVEAVSGMPYEQYVRLHIFEPLEMNDTSILLPDAELGHAARGYAVGAGVDEAFPLNYYYLNTAPGAGFNTTALDMTHYLMVILNGGEFTRSNGKKFRILSEDAARTLLETAFAYDEHLAGSANSFDERFYKGQRYLRKLGGAPGMQNNLVLMPEKELGFYLFTNTEGTGLRNNWEKAVAERYLINEDRDTVDMDLVDDVQIETEAYTGRYLEISDYTSETTIVQVRALFNPDVWVSVSANPDGSLQIWGRKYFAVSPTVYQDPLSGNAIAFEINEKRKAGFLFLDRTPYQRVSRIELPEFQMGLLGFAVLIFLTGLMRFGFQLLRSEVTGMNFPAFLSGLISSLSLLFLVALIIQLLPVATGGNIWQFSFAPSLALRLVLALPVFVTVLAAVLLVYTTTAWWIGHYNPFTRLFHSFILLGMAAFLFFLDTWNLLGWRF